MELEALRHPRPAFIIVVGGSRLPELDCHSALLTDLYELTMAAAYFENGFLTPASFELFVRSLPRERSYLVAAGLEQALDYLATLRFQPEDIECLRRQPVPCGSQSLTAGAITRHHLGDSNATKRSRSLHIGVAGLGRVHQKPANECDPPGRQSRRWKKLPYPIENEQKCDELPDARGDACGVVGVVGNRSNDRAQHRDTIERKAGNHVKDCESNVDIPQPDQDPNYCSLRFDRTVPAKAERDREAAETDNQAGDRPGDRDQEFCFRVVLDLGNTAEREQGDRPDFQAARLGH